MYMIISVYSHVRLHFTYIYIHKITMIKPDVYNKSLVKHILLLNNNGFKIQKVQTKLFNDKHNNIFVKMHTIFNHYRRVVQA